MADLISVLRASGGGYGERGVVALVAHWGVLHALTGRQPELTLTLTRGLITRGLTPTRSFANCEWADVHLSELPDTPFVEPDV